MSKTELKVGDRGTLNGVAFRIVKDCASGNLEVLTEHDEIISLETLTACAVMPGSSLVFN